MDIEKILASMSLENKAKLCIDGALWRTASIPENDVPILYMSDGTNGLRFWKNQADQDPMDRDFSKNYMSGAKGLLVPMRLLAFPLDQPLLVLGTDGWLGGLPVPLLTNARHTRLAYFLDRG
jgi:hypothetical protein